MKHRVKAKHFNRDAKSRKALLKNLLRDLFTHGEIKTSESRVKEVRRLADKLITKAKQGTLAARRDLHAFFGRRDVVNALVDKISPAVANRQSGFSTVEKLAARRGDNTVVYKLSLLLGELKLGSLKPAKPVVTTEAKTAQKTKEIKAEVKKAEVVTKKPAAAKKPATAKKPAAKAAKKKSTTEETK